MKKKKKKRNVEWWKEKRYKQSEKCGYKDMKDKE